MYLFTFVGNSDLGAANHGELEPPCGPGPVLSTLRSGLAPWTVVTLINDRRDQQVVDHYAVWLQARAEGRAVRVWRASVADPGCFETAVRAALGAIRAFGPRCAGERAYLTTPGTAAMAMAWTYLALQPATRARLVSAHRGTDCRWIALPHSATARS